MNKIKLVLGDWSRDGHGISKDYYVEVSCNTSNIGGYYLAGSDILGFDLVTDVCNDYGQDYVEMDVYESFKQHDIMPFTYSPEDYPYDVEATVINPEDFVRMYMGVVEIGYYTVNKEADCPKFSWEFVEEDVPTFKIGGYGIFSGW